MKGMGVKMKLFDTHSHYNDKQFENDYKEIIKQIYDAGVENAVVVGDNIESSKRAIEIANEYDFLYATVGIHPSEIGSSKEEIDKCNKEIEKICYKDKVVAIGEIGLDYHWEKENKDLQRYAFLEQIKLANKAGLPIVIHSRDAIMDTIDILKHEVKIEHKGILHCCQLNQDLVKAGLEAGLYISFAGAITFKSSKNANDIISIVPNDRILIETDCPYLSPEPHRGERNDSRNVLFVAKKIAEVKGVSLETIAEITYNNASKVYNIS